MKIKADNNSEIDNPGNYRKFKIDNSSDLGPGRVETPMVNEPNVKPNQFGQIKYAVENESGFDPIYRDRTRYTQNDTDAAEKSMKVCAEGSDESQGGKY